MGYEDRSAGDHTLDLLRCVGQDGCGGDERSSWIGGSTGTER